MKEEALIDLDGTCANFDAAMTRDLRLLQGPGEQDLVAADDENKHPYIKARRFMIKSQPDWWFNLEPIESGLAVVGLLRQMGYRLNILSAGPKKIPGAWEQKVRWCLKYIPDAKVTLTREKSLVYGRILVDDWVPYVTPWLKHRKRGIVLMPSRPWNIGFSHPQVIRYTDEMHDVSIRNEILALMRNAITELKHRLLAS